MFSAFEDGDTIVPVKLEVKEFSDKENTLYVAVTLEGIKKDEVVTLGNTETGVTRSARSSELRLSDLFGKVNKNNTSFLKYVPKQFLEPSNGTDGGMGGKLSRNLPGETAELQDEYDKLKEKLDYWKGLIENAAKLLGIPLYNIERDLTAITETYDAGYAESGIDDAPWHGLQLPTE